MIRDTISIDERGIVPTSLPTGVVPFELAAATSGAVLERFAGLRRLINATAERIWKFGDLHPHIETLEETLFALDDHGLLASMFLSSLSSAQIALQRVAYCQWETELERRFVHGLTSSSTIDDYALAARFRRLLTREVDLLGGRPERLLFIGSGPLPISAILAHEYLRVPVDCVDVDTVAVTESRRLLASLHLSDAVHVMQADGAGIDADRYDAILIALLAKPKNQILASLAGSARPDCKVVCRTSEGLREIVYEPMRQDRDLGLHVVCDKRSALDRGDTISSLLLALN
jgi:hypothetical protein